MLERFDIELEGFEAAPGADPAGDLASAFGLTREQASQLIASAPVVVKRDVDEQTAERIFGVLRGLGARVKLNKRVTQSMRPGGLVSSAPPVRAHSLPVPHGVPALPGSAPHSVPALPGSASHSVPALPGSLSPSSLSPAPGAAAIEWYCASCSRNFPVSETRAFPGRVGVEPARTCPVCRSVLEKADNHVSGPFLPRLVRCFAYPFQKSAIAPLLLVGVVAAMLMYIPLIGWIFSLGIQMTYLFGVTRHAVAGHDDFPTPSDFTDIMDIIEPAVRYTLAIIVAFAPAVLGGFLAPMDLKIPVAGALGACGLLYLPASFMVAALSGGCFGPLNVMAGFSLISRLPGPYAIITAGVALSVALGAAVAIVLQMFVIPLPVPILPYVVTFIVALASSTITFRMLGVFLHQYRDDLGIA